MTPSRTIALAALAASLGLGLIVGPHMQAAAQEAVVVLPLDPIPEATTISIGTLLGLAAQWLALAFGGAVAAAVVALIIKAFPQMSKFMDDERRKRIVEILTNGINLGGAKLAELGQDKFTISTKNRAIGIAIQYAKDQGAEYLKKLGVDPDSVTGEEALRANAEKIINDPNIPTPANVTPPELMQDKTVVVMTPEAMQQATGAAPVIGPTTSRPGAANPGGVSEVFRGGNF